MTFRLKHIAKMMAAAAVIIGAASCGGNSDPQTPDSITVSVKSSDVSTEAQSQFVSVSANCSWTLSLEFTGTDNGWVSVSGSLSGEGNKNLVLNFKENTGSASRTVKITAASARTSSSCSITQQGTGLNPDKAGAWMELPALDNSSLMFFTHPMTINGTKVRNYSFGWDRNNLLARWVAYPLNSWTIGSGTRHFQGTSFWANTLDPKLPRTYQPVTENPWGGSYQRGHQCPSADRLLSAPNFETFYGTNMTAQNGQLNEGAWAVLEGNVRTWAKALGADTLYVCTGCVPGSSKTTDNDGKKVTVPAGYFKALLAYRRSGGDGFVTTGKGYYASIAFYFENKDYSDTQDAVMAQSMTVTALEKKTGINFFSNLSTLVGQSSNDKIEGEIINWWKTKVSK